MLVIARRVACICVVALVAASTARAEENVASPRFPDLDRGATPIAPATSVSATLAFGYRSIETVRNGFAAVDLRGRFVLTRNVAIGAHLGAAADYSRAAYTELVRFGLAPAGIFLEIGGAGEHDAWSMSLEGDVGPRLLDAANLDVGSPGWATRVRAQYARRMGDIAWWFRGHAGATSRGGLSIQYGGTLGFALSSGAGGGMPGIELEAAGATDLATAWRVHTSVRIACAPSCSLLLRGTVGFPGDPEGFVAGLSLGASTFE